MRLDDREESENVEDDRGFGGPATMAVGGGGILILIVALFLGVDPRQIQQILGGGGGGQQQQAPQVPGAPGPDGGGPPPARPVDPEQDKQAHFTKVIFHDTEVIWTDLFDRAGKTYEKPILHLYTGEVESACGEASSAVGPFYCPGDSRVYIDLGFYTDMQRKLNAPGDFARAYVVAHEVGHHVQKLLGYTRLVDAARRSGDELEARHMSVRLELQADYFAGVWAYHGQKKYQFLDEGDLESALNAAFQIGDDRLMKRSRGTVVPDAFTHGSSKQRQRWFKAGFQTGDVAARASDLRPGIRPALKEPAEGRELR